MTIKPSNNLSETNIANQAVSNVCLNIHCNFYLFKQKIITSVPYLYRQLGLMAECSHFNCRLAAIRDIFLSGLSAIKVLWSERALSYC